MSKELEAFNEIIDKFAEQIMRANKEELTAINKTNAIEYLYRTPQVRLLQQALQRIEAIDNANPSEALNYLDQFINEMTKCLENPKQYAKDYDKEIFYKYKYTFETTIKQALIKSQEQEKVLEIIKEKKVNIYFISTINTYDEYLKADAHFQPNVVDYMGNYHKEQLLTQEEFDLLKRYCDEQD